MSRKRRGRDDIATPADDQHSKQAKVEKALTSTSTSSSPSTMSTDDNQGIPSGAEEEKIEVISDGQAYNYGRFVYKQNGKWLLDPEAKEKLNKCSSFVSFKTIFGRTRSGKSTTGNLLTGGQNFPTSNLSVAQTKWINISWTPIVFKHPKLGTIIQYVLDTEGNEANEKTANVGSDAQVIQLGILFSTTTILNIKGTVDKSLITTLDMMLATIKGIRISVDKTVDDLSSEERIQFMPTLIILLQSMQLELRDPNNVQRKITADEFFKNQIQSCGSEFDRMFNRAHRYCYSMVDPCVKTADIPYIGLDAVKMYETSIDEDDEEHFVTRGEYRKQIKHIRHQIFSDPKIVKPKSVCGINLAGPAMVLFIEGLLESYNSGKVPILQDTKTMWLEAERRTTEDRLRQEFITDLRTVVVKNAKVDTNPATGSLNQLTPMIESKLEIGLQTCIQKRTFELFKADINNAKNDDVNGSGRSDSTTSYSTTPSLQIAEQRWRCFIREECNKLRQDNIRCLIQFLLESVNSQLPKSYLKKLSNDPQGSTKLLNNISAIQKHFEERFFGDLHLGFAKQDNNSVILDNNDEADDEKEKVTMVSSNGGEQVLLNNGDVDESKTTLLPTLLSSITLSTLSTSSSSSSSTLPISAVPGVNALSSVKEIKTLSDKGYEYGSIDWIKHVIEPDIIIHPSLRHSHFLSRLQHVWLSVVNHRKIIQWTNLVGGGTNTKLALQELEQKIKDMVNHKQETLKEHLGEMTNQAAKHESEIDKLKTEWDDMKRQQIEHEEDLERKHQQDKIVLETSLKKYKDETQSFEQQLETVKTEKDLHINDLKVQTTRLNSKNLELSAQCSRIRQEMTISQDKARQDLANLEKYKEDTQSVKTDLEHTKRELKMITDQNTILKRKLDKLLKESQLQKDELMERYETEKLSIKQELDNMIGENSRLMSDSKRTLENKERMIVDLTEQMKTKESELKTSHDRVLGLRQEELKLKNDRIIDLSQTNKQFVDDIERLTNEISSRDDMGSQLDQMRRDLELNQGERQRLVERNTTLQATVRNLTSDLKVQQMKTDALTDENSGLEAQIAQIQSSVSMSKANKTSTNTVNGSFRERSLYNGGSSTSSSSFSVSSSAMGTTTLTPASIALSESAKYRLSLSESSSSSLSPSTSLPLTSSITPSQTQTSSLISPSSILTMVSSESPKVLKPTDKKKK
jgi:hypothetical protein